jgi:tyrosine-protein kinase Etk/Wzc
VTQTEGSTKVFNPAERALDPLLAAPAEDEISLLDLLIVFVRNRRLIFKVTLVMVVIGLVTSLLLPNRYTATTSILPPQQGGSAGAALMAQLGSMGSVASLAGGSLGLKNPNDLQVAMLKSRTVEDAMLDRFHLIALYHSKLRSDARKALENVVEIDSGTKDGLIRISVTDRNPQRAADLANGYVDEFKKRTATLAVTEASQRRVFFEQQLSQSKDNLAIAEEELKKTELKTGLIQLDSQSRATIELIAGLRAQIAAKEVQISSLRSYATGENPELQIAQQELAGLQSQAEKMGASSEGATNALVPKGNMQEAGLEYIRKLRDVKYYETIFNLMARQYEIAKVDEARQGALVQVVDRAVVPDRHSSPMRTLIVLGSAVLGLFFGIVWALSIEGLTRLSSNPAERPRLDTLKQLFSSAKKS